MFDICTNIIFILHDIRKKCRESNEEWLKNERAEIGKGKETDTKAMHKRIK